MAVRTIGATGDEVDAKQTRNMVDVDQN